MGPAFIHTLLDLAAVVELGTTTETLYLEFKRTIPNWNPPPGISNRHERIQEAQKEACRDIAQFANTLGGCLLIGVEGKFDPVRGVNVADSVVSVNEPEKLQQWVEQAVINYLVPSTFDHAVASIRHPAGNIIAINIPACQYLVSLWERKARTIEYVRRTSLGKEWMNPDEMERHLMNGSRAAKLTLISVRERSTSEQVEVLVQ